MKMTINRILYPISQEEFQYILDETPWYSNQINFSNYYNKTWENTWGGTSVMIPPKPKKKKIG